MQPPTVQSQGHLALNAQKDAHSEGFAHQNAGFGERRPPSRKLLLAVAVACVKELVLAHAVQNLL